jgi:hypothetical protein
VFNYRNRNRSRKAPARRPALVEQMESRQLMAQFNPGVSPDVVFVTSNPSVVPNDGIDDTAGIQAVINANKGRIVYFPNGTYNVSNTITVTGNSGNPDPNSELYLEGQSQGGVIIRLANSAAGFNSTATPKEVIRFVNNNNNNFRNRVKDMTVNLGTGNAGAIGMRFAASNNGYIENFTVTSGSTNSGYIGVEISGFNGPLHVKNLTVTGCDYGLYSTSPESVYSVDGLTLNNQDLYGLYTRRAVVSIRNFNSNQGQTSAPAPPRRARPRSSPATSRAARRARSRSRRAGSTSC